jgi:hypothetical protein
MKGTLCPEQINPTQVLSYDNFDVSLFESLPEILRKKIESSKEYKELGSEIKEGGVASGAVEEDFLPF